jgi:hypothetical protein
LVVVSMLVLAAAVLTVLPAAPESESPDSWLNHPLKLTPFHFSL